jgi:hypothetical protein
MIVSCFGPIADPGVRRHPCVLHDVICARSGIDRAGLVGPPRLHGHGTDDIAIIDKSLQLTKGMTSTERKGGR